MGRRKLVIDQLLYGGDLARLIVDLDVPPLTLLMGIPPITIPLMLLDGLLHFRTSLFVYKSSLRALGKYRFPETLLRVSRVARRYILRVNSHADPL